MPFQIIRDDITKVRCDAIVNAANSTLLGGGGVDGAIHRAAGPKLQQACARLGGCPAGQAKITKGYDLPCRYVIHTVGPIWRGGGENEQALLRSCYRESLALAVKYKCESVAFPLISAGSFGYPKEEALQIAMDEISHFLLQHELYVTLVVHDKGSFPLSRALIEDILGYIDDVYVQAQYFDGGTMLLPQVWDGAPIPAATPLPEMAEPTYSLPEQGRRRTLESKALDDLVLDLDESFSQMLLRKIDEKGMTDAQCYKKANIDRKLFSKIRSDVQYKPSKTTALAFVIALELDLDEANDMLKKAGYALSHSSKFDIIIEYFIRNRRYNIYEINEVLFQFDQSLLG
jgi:O-acetyl-ADP-ribose deacetylase (regulator of RNase III)